MGVADGGLRAVLKKYLPKPAWHWTPIETRGAGRDGVPDTHFVDRVHKCHGWIECKATDGWTVKFESQQLLWLKIHSAASVPCFVAVRASGVGSSAGTGDSLWILHGAAAEPLSLLGLSRIELSHLIGVWTGEPAGWSWPDVAVALRGGWPLEDHRGLVRRDLL